MDRSMLMILSIYNISLKMEAWTRISTIYCGYGSIEDLQYHGLPTIYHGTTIYRWLADYDTVDNQIRARKKGLWSL